MSTMQRAERTRNAVLNAACQAFLRDGVAGATLEEIADLAGLSHRMVYAHFKSKSDILLALDDRVRLPCELLLTDLVMQLEADPILDPLAELAQAVSALLAAIESDPERRCLLTVLHLCCDYADETWPASTRQHHADVMLRTVLDHVFELADFRGLLAASWQPHDAAAACLLLVTGLIRTWLRSPDHIRLAATGKTLLSAFLAMVAAPSEHSSRELFHPRPRHVTAAH
jgi:AcrR family transcriptional regulator